MHDLIVREYANTNEKPNVEVNGISFDDIPEKTFVEQHRFSKEDIALLMRAFNLRSKIDLENRQTIDSRVALCMLLRKLVFPIRLCDLERIYGYHRRTISRTLNYLVKYIDIHFKYLQ